MNTKTLNTYEKLWLANRASHNMALAGPTAFWLASGHREARPLHMSTYNKDDIITIIINFRLPLVIFANIKFNINKIR